MGTAALAIPDFQTLMLPVLRIAGAGEVKISDVVEKLAGEFSLSAEERSHLLPSGKQTTFANRVHWAKSYLGKANDKHGHQRGARYPLTRRVVRHYWEKFNLGKRWHDVRHTFGTRLYEISKDIHLVQRAMNHSDVKTTMRYVHADNKDVREAMEKLPFMNVNIRSANRHNPFSPDKKENTGKSNVVNMVPRKGLEPSRVSPLVPETSASTNSATWATAQT